MDAIALLTKDHDQVRRLFEQFRSAQDASNGQLMRETADKIFAELEVHTTIEEEIFYPAARGKDEEIDETLDESLQEHHVVDVLMEEMRGIESGSDEWVAKMTVLIENVEHHADEEEQELFPDTRKELGDERMEDARRRAGGPQGDAQGRGAPPRTSCWPRPRSSTSRAART